MRVTQEAEAEAAGFADWLEREGRHFRIMVRLITGSELDPHDPLYIACYLTFVSARRGTAQLEAAAGQAADAAARLMERSAQQGTAQLEQAAAAAVESIAAEAGRAAARMQAAAEGCRDQLRAEVTSALERTRRELQQVLDEPALLPITAAVERAGAAQVERAGQQLQRSSGMQVWAALAVLAAAAVVGVLGWTALQRLDPAAIEARLAERQSAALTELREAGERLQAQLQDASARSDHVVLRGRGGWIDMDALCAPEYLEQLQDQRRMRLCAAWQELMPAAAPEPPQSGP